MMGNVMQTQNEMWKKSQQSADDKKHWGARLTENLALSYLFMGGTQHPLSYPLEPGDHAKAFLSAPVKQALVLAVQNLTTQRETTHTIDLLYATRLHTLSFDSPNPDVPGGLSIFWAVPSPFASSKTGSLSQFALGLHIDSGTLTPGQIAKLSRSQIQVPKTRANLAITISNQLKTLELMFTMYCHIYRELERLGLVIDKYQSRLDWLFNKPNGQRQIAIIMATIDSKTNEFINSCLKAPDISEVNFDILNFRPEIDQLILGNPIQGTLPAAVEAYLARDAKGTNGDSDSDDSDGAPNSKKRKRQKKKKAAAAAAATTSTALATAVTKSPKAQDTSKAAVNKSPIDSWLLPKGTNQFSACHQARDEAPTLNGEPPCLKFHLLGKCPVGNKCHFKASHTTKLDDTFKTAFGKWAKGCAKKSAATASETEGGS
jgi:hypothetical protein